MKYSRQTKLTINRLSWVAFVAAFLVAGCSEEPAPAPPKPVKTLTLTSPGALTETTFPGRATAGKEANMSFRVSGPLVELPVSVGDKVDEGTVVAQIDPNDFEVALRNVESGLAAAQAAFQRANADYERLSKAQSEDPGATSQRAVDLALAARDETRAAVSSATATVQTAKDRLRYTSLKAPFDAEVVETYVENFETVIAKQPILRLLDSSEIEMILSVPENLIGYAGYVSSVVVTFDALPGIEVEGYIKEVGREATQSTRTYPVTIGMQQPAEAQVLPGMAGQATVAGELPDTVAGGIHVPSTALFTGVDPSKSYVWIVANDKVTQREVEVGSLTENGVLINSGLSAGEEIVAAGVNALVDGQAVRVLVSEESP